MVTIHDVLRALVRGERDLLSDAQWVEHALAGIAGHEAATTAAPAAADPAVSPVTVTAPFSSAPGVTNVSVPAAPATSEGTPG